MIAVMIPRIRTSKKLTKVSNSVMPICIKMAPPGSRETKAAAILDGLLKIKASIRPVLAAISQNTNIKINIRIRYKVIR